MSDDEVWYRAEALVRDGESGAYALWSLGASGVEIQDHETFMEGDAIAPVPEGLTRLIAFFDVRERSPANLEEELASVLDVEHVAFDRYEDTSWATAWRDFFHPVRLSERCMVGPPWEEFDAPQGGIRLVIEPGLAFGTGTHETTQLVGSLLDQAIGNSPPSTLLDVGCGSAILSMLARGLGVSRVVGIDVDEQAVSIAEKTVELNRIDAVELSTTPVEAIDERFPIVLANILGHILLGMRDELVATVEHGGLLLVSGVTIEQSDAFHQEFGRAPLELRRRETSGEWVAFEYERLG